MQINGEFFREAMRQKKLSVRKVANELGLNHHSQFSLTLSGRRRMQLDEAVRLAQLLSVPLLEVIANAGFPQVIQSGKRLPIVGILRDTGIIEDVPPKTERVVGPCGHTEITSAVQARTAGNLNWMDRWVFFCEDRDDPTPALLERFCHVQIKGGPQVMAMLRRGYSSGTFNLVGPYSAENVALEWAAPVCLTRM